MKKNWKTLNIGDIITDYLNTLPNDPSTAGQIIDSRYSITDGETRVVSGSAVIDILLYKYYERNIDIRPDYADDPESYLNHLFNMWINLNITDYVRAYKALNTVYEPLNNYSMTETKDVDINETLTETPRATTGTTTTFEPGIVDTVQSDVYGYNSSAASPSDIVSTTHTGRNTTTIEESKDGNNVNEKEYIEGYTLNRYGNIGVTTSQQMLQAEIDLRFKDYIEKLIHIFISEYTYY